MKRTVLNVMLSVILAGLVAANWLGQRDYRYPNVEFMPNMVASVPFDTFAPNPNFADGKTLQTPPPGTIPYGMLPFSFQATPPDALRAGLKLANPYANNDQAARDRGSVVYLRSCLPCHGSAGAGDGLVTKRGFPPPPALFAEHAINMKDGQLFHIITHGQGNMPGHAAQVALDDRWRVVLHVRQLQQRRTASNAPSATTTRATTIPTTATTTKAP